MRIALSHSATLLAFLFASHLVGDVAGANKTDQSMTASRLAVASVGGDSAVAVLSKASGMSMSGELSMNGSLGNFDFCYRAPDSFYLRLSLGPMTIEKWYDGFRGWQKSAGGILSTFEGRELDQFLLESRVMSMSYVRPDSRLRVSIGERTIWKNHQVRELIAVSGIDTMQLLLDAKRLLPIAKLTRLDNLIADETIDSVISQNGIAIPFRSTTELRGTGIVSTSSMTAFALNQSCAVWHAIPKERVSTLDAGPAEDSLPLYELDGHLYVPVTLKNGKKGVMLLDSGASANFLLKRIVDELGIDISANFPSRGVAGIEQVGLIELDSILVGNELLSKSIFGVTDIRFLSDRTVSGLPCFGILGYEFLARQTITIDYFHSLVRLHRPLRMSRIDRYKIPFTLHMNLPVVQVSLNGYSGQFVVDLGNNGGVILHEPFAREHHLLPADKSENAGVMGLGGVVSTWQIDINELAFETADSTIYPPLVMQNFSATVASTSSGLSGSTDLNGNLGGDFLRNFLVTFDYANKWLFLEPQLR